MRIHAFLRNVLLLLATASPAFVFAQFQQPTDEELKMTADPKVPGEAGLIAYNMKVAAADQQQLVLTTVPAAKGN